MHYGLTPTGEVMEPGEGKQLLQVGIGDTLHGTVNKADVVAFVVEALYSVFSYNKVYELCAPRKMQQRNCLYGTKVVDLFDRMRDPTENLTRFNPVPPPKWDDPLPAVVHMTPGGGQGNPMKGIKITNKAQPPKKSNWAKMRSAILFQAPFIKMDSAVRPTIAMESAGQGSLLNINSSPRASMSY